MAAAALKGAPDPAAARRQVRRVRVLTLAIVLALWEVLAHSGWVYQGVVPPLERIIAALAHMLAGVALYRHLAVTAWEVLGGFAVGFAAGLALAVPMGARRFFGDALAPYVDGLATAPKIVFLPIVMLLFGTGVASKLALGALSAFFPVVINTAAGIRQLNPVWVRVGRSFNLGPWQMVRRIYLPGLRTSMVTSMRLGFGLAVVGVLLAEIKLSSTGLGFLAEEHYSHFRIAELYAILLIIFVLAIGSNALIERLKPRH